MYIGRRLDGTIYGTWTCKQPNDEFHQGIEELPDNHPDVMAYFNRPIPVQTEPDSKAILNALIKKNLITKADAQAEIGK